MTRRTILFAFMTVLALAVGFLLPRHWLWKLFNYGGYYFILVAFALWGGLVIRVTGGRVGVLLKTYYPGLLLSAVVMTLVFHLMPPQFKILADEANLVGVSMAMHENKTVALPIQGPALVYADYNYQSDIDQRPLGYPFFISLCHALLGYSAYNGFVVNFVAGMLTLFFLYVMLSRAFSEFYGILGILLTAACPVFLLWSTSSGFEALNLFFVVFVLFTLYAFLRSRQVDQAELLFLSLVLLAHCRYESGIFILGLTVLWPFFTGRIILGQYRLPTLLCPVLLIPLIWQRRLCLFNAAVQFSDTRQVPDHLFGFGNLADHFSSNLFVLFGLNATYGFLLVVFVLAAIGVYGIVKRLFQPVDRLTGFSRPVIVYGLVCGVSLFLLYAAFCWGDFTLGIDNRLGMVFLPFLIVPAVYTVFRCIEGTNRTWKAVVIFLSILQIIYYWPVAEKQLLVQRHALTYEYNRVMGYIYANYDLDREKLLIISDRSSLYTIHKLGSVNFDVAGREIRDLSRLQQMYYNHILVLQRPNPRTGEVRAGQSLPDDYRLHYLTEIPVGPDYCVRISAADIQCADDSKDTGPVQIPGQQAGSILGDASSR